MEDINNQTLHVSSSCDVGPKKEISFFIFVVASASIGVMIFGYISSCRNKSRLCLYSIREESLIPNYYNIIFAQFFLFIFCYASQNYEDKRLKVVVSFKQIKKTTPKKKKKPEEFFIKNHLP